MSLGLNAEVAHGAGVEDGELAALAGAAAPGARGPGRKRVEGAGQRGLGSCSEARGRPSDFSLNEVNALMSRMWAQQPSFTNNHLSCFDKNTSCEGTAHEANPAAAQRIACLRSRRPPYELYRCRRRAQRHPGRDQPPGARAGAAPRIKIVRAPQSLAAAVGSGPGLPADGARGVRPVERGDREAAAEGSRRASHRHDHVVVRDEVAGAAAGRLPARQSRDRRARQHRHRAGRFLARGCRYRHPLRPRPVAVAHGRAAGERGHHAGLRAIAGQGAERA